MRLKLPKNLPAQIRELWEMDFSRENRCPSPGSPPPPVGPEEPAAGAPNACGSPQTEPGTSNPNPAVKETAATGRASNGRFAKCNRGGPGNPFARQVAAFRACLINNVTEDDFKAIVYELLELAKDGDLQAIKLLFSYLLGTPKPVVEPDELDLQERHLAHQTALVAAALQEAAPARPSANDAPPPLDGPVESPAASVHEAPPPPPASVPSTNRTNCEPFPPTTGNTPSTNRAADVSEVGQPSQPPSTNRPNGEPAVGVSKTRPSTNGPNRAREADPVCGESPGRQTKEQR